jgi:hypothetical protein
MLAFVALCDRCVAHEDELRQHARRRLADLKLPDKIVFSEKVPKGISGKIQRTALKEFEIVAAKSVVENPRLALRGICEPWPRVLISALCAERKYEKPTKEHLYVR